MNSWRGVLKFVAHGKLVQRMAARSGWHPAARYTNLRDVRRSKFSGRGFLDIDWKNYDFVRHLAAVRDTKPLITVARDIERMSQIESVLREAEQLAQYASRVVIVPKAIRLASIMESEIPTNYLLGYSVPTKYGGTRIAPESFRRPVHLLGGRPDVQRRLAEVMQVVSFDCNRFTLDAAFGDYFDGSIFRPHPSGGYENCLRESLKNICDIWSDYGIGDSQQCRGEEGLCKTEGTNSSLKSIGRC